MLLKSVKQLLHLLAHLKQCQDLAHQEWALNNHKNNQRSNHHRMLGRS
jgi:hypothetical protein